MEETNNDDGTTWYLRLERSGREPAALIPVTGEADTLTPPHLSPIPHFLLPTPKPDSRLTTCVPWPENEHRARMRIATPPDPSGGRNCTLAPIRIRISLALVAQSANHLVLGSMGMSATTVAPFTASAFSSQGLMLLYGGLSQHVCGAHGNARTSLRNGSAWSGPRYSGHFLFWEFAATSRSKRNSSFKNSTIALGVSHSSLIFDVFVPSDIILHT